MIRWPHGVVGALAGWWWGDAVIGRVPGWPEATGAALGLGLLAYATVNVRSQGFAPAVCRGQRTDAVALTFDDGPDPASTTRVLDILARHRAPAAFFCIGEKVASHVQLVRRAHAEGHEVHSHGWVHRWPAYTTVAGVRDAMARAEDAIAGATGAAPAFFRPPYGLIFPAVGTALRQTGRVMCGWSLRTHDAGLLGPEAVLRRTLARVRGGDVLLLHDAPEQSGGRMPHGPAVLDALLGGLAAKGLRPVALSELLQ